LLVWTRVEARATASSDWPSATWDASLDAGSADDGDATDDGTDGAVVAVDGVGTASKATTISKSYGFGPAWQDPSPPLADEPVAEEPPPAVDELRPTRVTPSMSSREETKPATAS
jgi:hypothetical protein